MFLQYTISIIVPEVLENAVTARLRTTFRTTSSRLVESYILSYTLWSSTLETEYYSLASKCDFNWPAWQTRQL